MIYFAKTRKGWDLEIFHMQWAQLAFGAGFKICRTIQALNWDREDYWHCLSISFEFMGTRTELLIPYHDMQSPPPPPHRCWMCDKVVDPDRHDRKKCGANHRAEIAELRARLETANARK